MRCVALPVGGLGAHATRKHNGYLELGSGDDGETSNTIKLLQKLNIHPTADRRVKIKVVRKTASRELVVLD
jgi:hypothetical protein